MSSLLIRNGTLVTLNARQEIIPGGSVFIKDGRIVEVGVFPDAKHAADRVIDAGGMLVMPGFINVHHHLYSTFARGFAPPGEPASNFQQILERLWWKLDKALDSQDVYDSARLALLDAVRGGCTTIVDHHASPSCRDGSLDRVEQAFRDTGLNGCLCYEVSDRNEAGAGIPENERFIKKCRASGDDQITALFGLHASMTLGPETLERCADAGRRLGAGFHVHVAEAECDHEVSAAQFGAKNLMERFQKAGITGPNSLFAHGIHLDRRGIDILRETNSMLATNPESNMNNGLAVTPILELLQRGVLAGLGTDGMSNSLPAQARAGYLIQRAVHRDPRIAFGEYVTLLLRNNRSICSRLFRDPRGALIEGHLADVILLDYTPFTPMTADNLGGHLLFGLAHTPVHTTIARGRVLMEAGRILGIDEQAVRAKCVERARALWARIV